VYIHNIIYKIIIIFCCFKAKAQQKVRRKQKIQLKIITQKLETQLAIKRLIAIKRRIKKEQQAL